MHVLPKFVIITFLLFDLQACTVQSVYRTRAENSIYHFQHQVKSNNFVHTVFIRAVFTTNRGNLVSGTGGEYK